jgi:hypothetical protein
MSFHQKIKMKILNKQLLKHKIFSIKPKKNFLKLKSRKQT